MKLQKTEPYWICFTETKGFVDLLFDKLETGIQDDPNFQAVKIKEEPQEGGGAGKNINFIYHMFKAIQMS